MYKWCSFNANILSIESGANVPEVCGFDLYSLSEHSKARTAI